MSKTKVTLEVTRRKLEIIDVTLDSSELQEGKHNGGLKYKDLTEKLKKDGTFGPHDYVKKIRGFTPLSGPCLGCQQETGNSQLVADYAGTVVILDGVKQPDKAEFYFCPKCLATVLTQAFYDKIAVTELTMGLIARVFPLKRIWLAQSMRK